MTLGSEMSALQMFLAIGSGGVVGFTLGLVGGGGSIMAVPLLVYVVGVASPHLAIGTSAVAVAVSAAANLIGHARAHTVKWNCAIVFALAGAQKVLGLGPTKENFERWPTPEWMRPIVGTIELVIAACAVGGLAGNASGTQIAGLLALWVMIGAIAVHGMAGDPPKMIAPAIALLAVALVLLATTT